MYFPPLRNAQTNQVHKQPYVVISYSSLWRIISAKSANDKIAKCTSQISILSAFSTNIRVIESHGRARRGCRLATRVLIGYIYVIEDAVVNLAGACAGS